MKKPKRKENNYGFSTGVGVVGVLLSAVGWPPAIAAFVLCITIGLCIGISRLEELAYE